MIEVPPRAGAAIFAAGATLCVSLTLWTNTGWYGPNAFAGDTPTMTHPVECHSFEGDGIMSTTTACPDNLRESILTWTMGAGGHTSTDISVSYDNRHPEVVGELFGSLRLDEGGECGAAVEWTISHQGTHLSSVLTAAEPESRSLDHYSIPDQGVRQIRVDLRRLDARPCQAAVVWDHASFKRP